MVSMQRFSLVLATWPDRPQRDAVAKHYGDTGMRCTRRPARAHFGGT